MAMSVDMFRCRLTNDCKPRTKNGQPAHRTTGVVSANWIQRETSPDVHSGAFGNRCDIASTKTGKVSAAPVQRRRVMSLSSESSSGGVAEKIFGSSAIPQIGH